MSRKDQLERIKQQIERLKAREAKLRAREREEARKLRTRALILIGSQVMNDHPDMLEELARSILENAKSEHDRNRKLKALKTIAKLEA